MTNLIAIVILLATCSYVTAIQGSLVCCRDTTVYDIRKREIGLTNGELRKIPIYNEKTGRYVEYVRQQQEQRGLDEKHVIIPSTSPKKWQAPIQESWKYGQSVQEPRKHLQNEENLKVLPIPPPASPKEWLEQHDQKKSWLFQKPNLDTEIRSLSKTRVDECALTEFGYVSFIDNTGGEILRVEARNGVFRAPNFVKAPAKVAIYYKCFGNIGATYHPYKGFDDYNYKIIVPPTLNLD